MADSKISDLPEALTLVDTDEFVLASSGASKKVTKATIEAELEGMLQWVLLVDLPLTSTTSWSMPAAWSNDGTSHIVGVNTPQTRNLYNVRLPLATFIAQVEIQMPSTSRSAADQRAGILMNWNGSGTGAPLVVLRWNAKANATLYDERDAADGGQNETISGGLALDTWHTLRVMRSGMHTAEWVNGVFHRVSRIDPHAASMAQVHFVGLYGYQIDARFRNLKIWIPRLPA